MCLAIVSLHSSPDFAVFIASNRDEFYERPTAPPGFDEREQVRYLAPRDLRSGGTWIGTNDRGIFALLLNRSDLDSTVVPTPRSRGLLVLDALGSRSVDEAIGRVMGWRNQAMSPFTLIVGDPGRASRIESDGRSPWAVEEWQAGVHFVSDRGPAADTSVPVVARARELWDGATRAAEESSARPGEGAPRESRLWEIGRRVLAPPEQLSDDPAEIFRRGLNRGTVATTLIGIDTAGRGRMIYADTTTLPVAFATYPLSE